MAFSGGKSESREPVAPPIWRDLAVELAAAEGVDLDGDLLAGTHLVELGLLEVRGDPEVGERNDGEEVLADADRLAPTWTFFLLTMPVVGAVMWV